MMMPISDEVVAQLNLQESQFSQDFFKAFAQSITVYEDNDIWVVDKPAGLLSVDGKSLKVSLLSRLYRANPKVKLIHRLDMDTSGLMIFAKNAAAQSQISKQFIERLPQKTYQARVMGRWLKIGETGRIDVPVRYEPETKPRHIVDLTWKKNALTLFKVLAHESVDGIEVTRVQLKPVTGRSHQLRVHMLHAGHVMIGDPIYAEGTALNIAPRLNLHAQSLRLKHPVLGAWMDWESAVPF